MADVDATTAPPPDDPIIGIRAKRFSLDIEGKVAFIEVLRVRQSGEIAATEQEATRTLDEYQQLVAAVVANPHGKTLIAWLISTRPEKYGNAALTP